MYHGERFNGYTHLAGALLAAAGASILILAGALQHDTLKIVSFSVYGATLVVLFSASTLYHSTRGKLKTFFRKADHSAIYLLIAGTYTPFTLVTLQGGWGWSLFGAVWALALLGIVQELSLAQGKRRFSLALYIIMGWVALIGVVPLVAALGWDGFLWVIAGGIVYTLGTVFYFYDEKFAHWHGIWHLFVLIGAAIHFFAILKFVA
jgi:hemolysin III